MRGKQHFLVIILTIITTTAIASAKKTITTRQLTEDEQKKLKNADNRKTHPKVKVFNQNSNSRPTTCQVCRVMVQELSHEINKTKNTRKTIKYTNELDGKTKNDLSYKTSELRIMDIMDTVCMNVDFYRSIAGPEFPFLKNVNSMYRDELDEAMKTSGLSLSLDGPPHMIDDPTSEIKRLHFECIQMVEEYEDDIIDWFKNHQHKQPIEYICRDHVLIEKDNGCLDASTEIPEWGFKTKKVKQNKGIYNLWKSKTEL